MKRISDYIHTHHSSIAFWVCAGVSVGLMIGSFFAPPMGVIDSSVIMSSGVLFSFAALGVIPSAIKEGRGVKVKHNDTEIEIEGKRNEN